MVHCSVGEQCPKPLTLHVNKMAELHEKKARQLMYHLDRLSQAPQHTNILIGGDSHLTGMDDKDVDPSNDQVRVCSVGGLCIYGAALALTNFKSVIKGFSTVLWVLGTNDAQSEHISDHGLKRVKHLQLLHSESKRIFPNAVISIVTPFSGIKGVDEHYLANLIRDIKYVSLRVLQPPSVKNNISRKNGGIHLSKGGREIFINFLRSQLVKPSRDSL